MRGEPRPRKSSGRDVSKKEPSVNRRLQKSRGEWDPELRPAGLVGKEVGELRMNCFPGMVRAEARLLKVRKG